LPWNISITEKIFLDVGGDSRAAQYLRMSTDHQRYSSEN